LALGTRLGPYEIVASLGSGGMGEVYRARDTRLDRTVAIKILRDTHADLGQRFAREAKAIAALTHLHICTLFDIGHEQGTDYLVMECLEGETLAVRLRRGPLPLDEALKTAIEIGSALDKAHCAGIVHRDLKPSNVMLTKAGAKLLDFGLAKFHPTSRAGGVTAAITLSLSGVGTLTGTVPYMAPEQLEGRDADARSDLFAFGAVLYEMVTGRPAFQGESQASVIAAILEHDPPPISALQPLTPPTLDHVIKKCLAKDPEDRWQTARDLVDDLKWIAKGVFVPPPVAPSVLPAWRWALPWAATGIFGVALVSALLVPSPRRSAPALTPLKLLANIGADASMPTDFGASAVLSPDGTTIAFVAQQAGETRLFIRKLDQLQAAALAGTEGAASPFFSPGGQWVAFFADGKLKKVSVTGGAAVNLCDAPTGHGGTWTDDDTIIFTPASVTNTTLMRVSAAGGTPAVFGALDTGALTQRWPQALPGGKGVLYTEHSAKVNFDGANLVVAPLSGGTPKIVVRGGYYGRYVPSQHLVYMQQGTLFAVGFDLDRLETMGQAVPALEGVAADPAVSGGAQLAFSSEGTLVYVPGAAATRRSAIDWMTRDGKSSVLNAKKADWANPRFSPDGQKLAFEIFDGRKRHLWVYEVARDTFSQLTFDPGEDQVPVWTPDGRRIVFSSDRAKTGISNLYWVNADGTGDVTRLTDSPDQEIANSWHPSGKFLAFNANHGATLWDVMILPMEGDAARGWTPGKPHALLSTPAREYTPMFSPDGRWIAYFSNEAGGNSLDVYVRPFPGPGGSKWRVSTEGGQNPHWSPTSNELLFVSPTQGTVMVAPYTVVGDSFHADKPHAWSLARIPTGARSYGFDIHPDGKRLAVVGVQDQSSVVQDKVVFVFNFFDYLRKIAPGGK